MGESQKQANTATKEPTSGNEPLPANYGNETAADGAQKDVDDRAAKLESYEVPEESRQKEAEGTPSTRIVGTTDTFSVWEGNEQVAGPFKTRQEAFEANQKHREGSTKRSKKEG